MDEKYLRKLLKKNSEPDWFDFKQELKLYSADGKLANIQNRDELIKDILGLANGNASIIKKTKYLIIGADDKKFTDEGLRVLHNVDYKVPTQGEINKWVNDACTPAVVGIECSFEDIDNYKLYIITIPPTFELHETTRDLIAKGRHSKHTVFMRKGEHTEPASTRDGVAIQQLKLLYRQEIIRPSSIVFGALIGLIIAILFWTNGYDVFQRRGEVQPLTKFVMQVFAAITGGLIGAEAGWFYKLLKETQHEWHYFSIRKKIIIVVVGLASVLTIVFWQWFR